MEKVQGNGHFPAAGGHFDGDEHSIVGGSSGWGLHSIEPALSLGIARRVDDPKQGLANTAGAGADSEIPVRASVSDGDIVRTERSCSKK